MKIKINERTLQELSYSIRKNNIRIIGYWNKKRVRREQSLFKQIVDENFPNL